MVLSRVDRIVESIVLVDVPGAHTDPNSRIGHLTPNKRLETQSVLYARREQQDAATLLPSLGNLADDEPVASGVPDHDRRLDVRRV